MLYKYRSLKAFKYFVDILMRNRLHAAKYFDLNDPMEGHYPYDSLGERMNRNIEEKLKGEKSKLRICSLTKDKDNMLMWSHYADSHRGAIIGVKIDENRYITKKIKYDGLKTITTGYPTINTAISILSHKLEPWRYEDEVRVFVEEREYVEAEVKEVKEVILVRKISNQDYGFIRDLVEKINPEIHVIRMRDL